MNENLLIGLNSLYREAIVRFDVEKTLYDIVSAVEESSFWDERQSYFKQISVLKKSIDSLQKNIEVICREKQALVDQSQVWHSRSVQIRHKFMVDIGEVICESKNIANLKSRIKEMEMKLLVSDSLKEELTAAKQKIRLLERTIRISEQTDNCNTAIVRNAFIFLEDKILLSIFSFLTTNDVISAAQICRYIFKKVDTLFGIESQIVREEWRIPPPAILDNHHSSVTSKSEPTTSQGGSGNSGGLVASQTSAPAGPTGLTKQMAEEISKKLTGPELKTIIAMTERLKKMTASMDSLHAENEDVKAKLKSAEQVRDFLVTKLKDAEHAIKSAMVESMQHQKQIEKDNEVISYLDGRFHTLEGENINLNKKCDFLQASLDLLRGSNTHNEREMGDIVADWKEKYETAEQNFKNQKKTLVKEVKTLRIQLDATKEERDKYASKLDMFRNALEEKSTAISSSAQTKNTPTNSRR